jgi:hypothetical protein
MKDYCNTQSKVFIFMRADYYTCHPQKTIVLKLYVATAHNRGFAEYGAWPSPSKRSPEPAWGNLTLGNNYPSRIAACGAGSAVVNSPVDRPDALHHAVHQCGSESEQDHAVQRFKCTHQLPRRREKQRRVSIRGHGIKRIEER